MSLSDVIREHNEVMQPVLDAIDTALRSGKLDTESLTETIERHVDWWVDEVAASEGQ